MPRPVAGARPADEARRALRAARERDALEAGAADATDEQPAPLAARGVSGRPPKTGSSPGARPGDVAREALRRATGAGSTPPSRPAEGASGGARPGDIAREALRAARDEARRAQTDAGDDGVTGTGAKGVEAGRRSAEPNRNASRTRRSRPRQDGGSRARDLRDLLAGAFELPTDVTSDPHTAQPRDVRGAASDSYGALPRDVREAASDSHRVLPQDAHEATSEPQPAQPGDAREAASHAYPAQSGDARRVRPESSSAQPGDDGEAASHAYPAQSGDARRVRRESSSAQPGDDGEAASHAYPAQSGDARRVRRESSSAQPGDDGEAFVVRRPARTGSVPDAIPGPLPAHPGSEQRGAPRAHRLPRSMGSPGRDGELRRTFPAFPARVSGADAFAETWWGNAWVTALEEGALDAARLARGRAYAGRGYVDAITVTPGLVLAYVHGSRPRPYRVQVRVRTLSDGDWDRFLDAAAERPGHIAALLDKEMPKSLAECGVALLPGPGELEPHCSCPDSGHPCKHAAALCYQTARLLDEDPFVLLLLRGRGERELLDALSRRNAARAARAAQEQEPAPLPGVRARDVIARRALPTLPAPLPPPAHPEQPPTYPGSPGGPDPFALDQLATDAAARAHALLTTSRDPVAELTLWQDAVRLAAARPGSGLTAATRALYSSLASATGRTPADLARAVAAWRQGGFDALSVLEEPWDPPAGRFDRARPLLLAADLPAFRPWRNHLTHPRGHAQLRLGHNGLWYAYESEPGHDDWWPRGTPDLDPVGALTGLGAPGDL
ncbi:SWIM zinc finger family protein [Streptomyces albiflavescens]|uniref:SWIM zinc finger family protein n=1 Tax=Streptomyces albiflavescens TaxID=1623582 RepID=UPI001668B454